MLSSTLSSQLSLHHPVPLAELGNLERQAMQSADGDLLQLCAAYIETVLNDGLWRPARKLTGRERAYLAFTEQFVSSVSTLGDEQVESLRPYASADEIYNFVCALYVIDMTTRLDLVMGRVLS